MKWASKSGNREVQKEPVFTEERWVSQTESSGSAEGLLGSVTARAGGVATVTVPMDCAWSASGPPGSLYADAYHSPFHMSAGGHNSPSWGP